jgi:N-acetylglutamate synthase-like GNAT family acetyltransferase
VKQSNLQRNRTLTAVINHWQLQEVLLLKSALAIKNVSAEFIVVEEGQAMLGQRTATDLGILKIM